MNDIAFYASQIARHLPQLAIHRIVLNQNGQYNHVLIVNDELIFRFAKVPDAIKTLQHEVAILAAIQNRITLSIPKPIYTHIATDGVGEAFIGYRMIAGTPLWLEALAAIPDPGKQRRIAHQIGQFLRELHHVPLQEAGLAELPVTDTHQEWYDLYQRIERQLFVYMRPAARCQVAQHFDAFFNKPQRGQFVPALRHGDFGTGNLLFDPKQATMTGIIDFGSAGIGDPAIDFAGLYNYGEAFYQHCCAVYPEMEAALPRVNFYHGTFALQEALFGIENGDAEAFQSGIADYL
jgi:aminoglycoside 2''-phosphotransferase